MLLPFRFVSHCVPHVSHCVPHIPLCCCCCTCSYDPFYWFGALHSRLWNCSFSSSLEGVLAPLCCSAFSSSFGLFALLFWCCFTIVFCAVRFRRLWRVFLCVRSTLLVLFIFIFFGGCCSSTLFALHSFVTVLSLFLLLSFSIEAPSAIEFPLAIDGHPSIVGMVSPIDRCGHCPFYSCGVVPF